MEASEIAEEVGRHNAGRGGMMAHFIFVRRVNEKYQVLSANGPETILLAEFRTWNEADDYALVNCGRRYVGMIDPHYTPRRKEGSHAG